MEIKSNFIFWCNKCDVPLATDVCGICKNRGKKTAFTSMKLVFKKEIELYEKLFKKKIKFLPEPLFRSRSKLIFKGDTFLTFSVMNEKNKLNIVGNFQSYSGKKSKIDYKEYISKIVKANQKYIKNKEEEAIKFIRNAAKKDKERRILTSFSGGKDSIVTAHLMKKALNVKDILFSNTGIEFPETVNYARKFAREYGYNLIECKPNRGFLDLCKELGPPSRMMRWCCSTNKAQPINDFYSKQNKLILSLDGIRKAESRARSTYSRISDNTKIQKQKSIYPILEWSDFDVWLYIFHEKLLFNPLYRKGYRRVGCWGCPNMNGFDSFLITHTHPEISKKFRRFLFNYAKEYKKTKDWVTNGYWKSRRVKYYDINAIRSPCVSEVKTRFFYFLNKKITSRTFEFFKPLGEVYIKKSGDLMGLNIISKDVKIFMATNSNTIELKIKNIKNLYNIKRTTEKQIEKSLNCINCGACIGGCPNDAIIMNSNKFRVLDEKCTHCMKCTKNDYLGRSCVALHYKANREKIKK